MLPGEDFVAGLPPGIEGEVDLSDGSSTVLVSLEPDDVGTDPFGVDPFGIIAIGADIPLGLDGTTDAPIAPGDFSTSLEAVLGYAASDTD